MTYTDHQINTAKDLGVNVIDMMAMAQSMINSFDKDGVTDHIPNMNKSDFTELVQSYAPHEVRKHGQFCDILRTNPEAKRELHIEVLGMLK